MFPYLKFRLQRAVRRGRRDVLQWRGWLSGYFQQHVWGKWRQLGIIRRLVVAWWGVLVLSLIGLLVQSGGLRTYYLISQPVAGGILAEGDIGTVTNINPILPESGPATSVDRLVFSGLTRINPKRQLEGDLAQSWTVSQDGRTYTFNLRHGVHWHDGVPFTARDVVFTIQAIQNPDTRSPLANSWQGVTVTSKDDYTVVITLPTPFTPFIYSTTMGILPSHILETTDPQQMRVSDFNQHPIGTGPFKLSSFLPAQGEIQLVANQDYYAGKPKLEGFTFRLYTDQKSLDDAFAKRQVMAIGSLAPRSANAPVYQDLALTRMGLASEMAVFLRTSSPALSDKSVRQALAAATDRRKILNDAVNGYGSVLTLPLLPGSAGYTTAFKPPALDANAAQVKLAAAGWQKDPSGKLTKDGKPMKLKLVTGDTQELRSAAADIQKQWSALGIEVDVIAASLNDLQQTYIRPRNYDVLLYGVSIGGDPDVYPYWHSSQASDPGLNLSQWSNASADKAMESGRILSDPDVRAGKYHAFLSAWVDDTPAIVLYEPDYIYAASKDIVGVKARLLVDPPDRFYDVQNWTAKTRQVPRQ